MSDSEKDSKRYTFYHYTDEKGAKAIEESKTIKASTNTATDAAFGKAPYVTRIPPETDTKTILQNNYDDYLPRVEKEYSNRTDYVVEVNAPKDDFVKAPSDRDIYLHRHGDLKLTEENHKIYKRNKTD